MEYLTIWRPTFRFLYPLLFLSQQFILPGIGQNRITNGVPVNPPHKYPYVVSIFFTGCIPHQPNATCQNPRPHCGGVVYDKRWILTSATCVFPWPRHEKPNLTNFYVLTGVHETGKLEPWSQNLSVVQIMPHEEFMPHADDVVNDIALIRVNKKIVFNDKVAPTNLPSREFDVKKDGEAMAIALGWGSTKQNEVGDPHIPKELQQVEQPLVTLPTCQRSWSVVPATPNVDRAYVVTDSMVCAGYATGDRRHCSLDQGGPLLMFENSTNTYVQIGIISGRHIRDNFLCNRTGTYDVYTKVSRYMDWITHKLQHCKPRYYGGKGPKKGR